MSEEKPQTFIVSNLPLFSMAQMASVWPWSESGPNQGWTRVLQYNNKTREI